MKRLVFLFVLVFLFLAGCAYQPVVIRGASARVITNLPLQSTGLLIANKSQFTLTVTVVSLNGLSEFRDIRPGGRIFVPLPRIWQQEVAVTVDGYLGGEYRGGKSRTFRFYNSGVGNNTKVWDVRNWDIRQR